MFTRRRASPIGSASPLPRSHVSVKFFVKICFRLYEEGQPSLARSRYWLPRSRLEGLEIFHVNSPKRAGPPRRASKSKLRTHDKGCLDQHFLNNFSFHELCVRQYRIPGFVGKLINPGDLAKRASPGTRAAFSHVNARWNPALLLRLALPRRLALLHITSLLKTLKLGSFRNFSL